ncbi:MAG TPA: NDP-sugar synthase [Actinomycetota bacterium]|nr:NDP-sugar synthase [Actinomycetota bacterium]
MKAVVLVGGEGTRLRPLTETVPKPLIPFMNRPFLHHVLDHLARYDVEEAVLSSPYLEREFQSFLDERSGLPRITWITEPEPLGTCGAVVGARGLLDGTFLVLNGDVLTDLDLSALVAFHHEQEAVATIALAPVQDARPYGLVDREEGGRVLAFREKPPDPVPGTINAGTYVLEPGALDDVPEGVAVSIERETFPGLIARGERVYSLLWEGYWRDLGTPEAYLQAHLDALGGLIGEAPSGAPLLGEGASVHPDALVGPLVVLGPGVSVGAGARIDRSVLHRGSRVGEGAVVEDSILGPESEVGPGVKVRDSVLADRTKVMTH